MPDVYGRVNPNVQEINNMKNIDAGLINKMAKGRYGTDRSEHKYPIKAKGWNAN